MSEALRDKSEQLLGVEKLPPRKDQKPNWAKKLEITNLPRLPIPELKLTLQRYIETVTPLLSDDELKETKRKVAEFLETDGPKLHEKLQELAKESPTSWLEGFWNTMYLTWRDPVVIHINPCFVFEDDPTPIRNKRVPRAASLIFSTTWFIKLIRAGQLPGDFEKDFQLDMSQYSQIFSTTRIPNFGRDRLVTNFNSTHIAVVCKNHYYWFDVFDKDNKQVEQEVIEKHLNSIVEMANNSGDVPPLGMLTAAERDFWANSYYKLIEHDELNKVYLEKLCGALFLVCLDEHAPKDLVETGKVMLHSNGHNRWFDKSIQLIVCENGKAGINMEHSPFDGHTCLRFTEDVFNYSVRTRCDSPASFESLNEHIGGQEAAVQINEMPFILTPDIVEDINRAEMEFDKLASSLHTGILHFLSFGKAFMTKYGVSPDALVQVAFQVTQFKIFGKLGSTYESVNTKKYYHGRTECMRPVTNEMLNFITVLCNPGSSATEQLELFHAASKAHVSKVSMCKIGEGVDRHLYGMHNLAKQMETRLPNYTIPDIYTDIAWARLRHDVLSTSNCGGYSLSSFGFGPVVPEGLGVGYIIKDKCMHFHVTAFSERPTKKFVKFMEQSLLELGQLLVSSTPFTIKNKSKL